MFDFLKSQKIDHKKNCENMSLRQVMDYTRNVKIEHGGLEILIERFVKEIEELKDEIKSIRNP